MAEKTVETVCILAPGVMIEDYAWKDAREPKAVCFSTDTPDLLSVCMGIDWAEAERDFRVLVESYREHGWKVKVYGEDKSVDRTHARG
jgi:hypothetical protein